MEKIIIGIVGKPMDKKDSLWSKLKITDEFRKIILEKDCIPIGILPMNFDYTKEMNKLECEKMDYLLEQCDGFILQGGWSQGTHELYVVKYAITHDIPILGVCDRFNNMLLALGDTLQDEKIEAHNIYDKDYRHEIQIKEDSMLYNILGKERTIQVNSIHIIVAKEENIKHYDCVAHSSDGFVEAIELKNKRFVLGVK